jgi:hypothetical protein
MPGEVARAAERVAHYRWMSRTSSISGVDERSPPAAPPWIWPSNTAPSNCWPQAVVQILADTGALEVGRFEHRLLQLLRLNHRPP